MDNAKEFKDKLVDVKHELEKEYEDDDSFGDVGFINDFAAALNESINNLSTNCDRVIEDCRARKQRLTDALIWDSIGEQEKW